ncbi:hypothetical protein RNAN_3430 [Rheinheimera nanhaiensis E407-8]|uniref:Uncharacterized protein n=1 Tax=Rheinheimera nanhaiensis E407-8 TaxID=562729 RepID=I1E278_9GAMM|nr:hypothetical protein RNAN_3430 [Rheinheimera nanhaiensis E407-8]
MNYLVKPAVIGAILAKSSAAVLVNFVVSLKNSLGPSIQ